MNNYPTHTTVYFSRKHFTELKHAAVLRHKQIFGIFAKPTFSGYIQYLIYQDLIKHKLFTSTSVNPLDSIPNQEEIEKVLNYFKKLEQEF